MTHKKIIPHPSKVPLSRENDVLALVKEQFLHGHYGVKPGSVSVTSLSEGEDQVSFIRTHDPKVPAAHHGIEGVE